MDKNITKPDADLLSIDKLNIDEMIAHTASAPMSIPEAGFLGRIIKNGGFVFAGCIIMSAVILLTEVFLRYVFNSPTIWAHETTTFLCGISFLYGGLYCAARDSHIRVVLIYDLLSPRMRRIFDVVISLVSAFASLFFAYAAYLMVKSATYTPRGKFRLETSGSAWDPPTPALVKIFLFCMLIVLTLQFIILALNYYKRQAKESN